MCVVLALLVPHLASAHAVGISRGEYELKGKTVSASLVFARPEIATIVPSIVTANPLSDARAERIGGSNAFPFHVRSAPSWSRK